MKGNQSEHFINTLHEILIYDHRDGHMYWRERDIKFFKTDVSCRLWNGKNAGKRAGSVVKRGRYEHRVIWIFNESFLEHRIAWMMFYKENPPEQIDHVNRVAKDNRISNLRASDKNLNHKNKSMARTNTSGYTGVSWSKKSKKWQAYGKDGDRQVSLGVYDDVNDAARVAKAFRDRAGYEPTHGMLTNTL